MALPNRSKIEVRDSSVASSWLLRASFSQHENFPNRVKSLEDTFQEAFMYVVTTVNGQFFTLVALFSN